MSQLKKYPRLRRLVEEAATAVSIVDWRKTFEIPYGACIPIAYFTKCYLNEDGIDARVAEAGARFVDPLSKKYAEMDTNEPSLEARDRRGLPFLGHVVTYVPTHRTVIDLSLPTQNSTVIRNLGMVDVLVGEVDHTKGQVGFRSPFGRGEAIYRIYPKRDGWTQRIWPYRDIEELAHNAHKKKDEFEVLRNLDVEFSRR